MHVLVKLLCNVERNDQCSPIFHQQPILKKVISKKIFAYKRLFSCTARSENALHVYQATEHVCLVCLVNSAVLQHRLGYKTETELLIFLEHTQCIFRSRCACGGETMFKVVGNLSKQILCIFVYRCETWSPLVLMHWTRAGDVDTGSWFPGFKLGFCSLKQSVNQEAAGSSHTAVTLHFPFQPPQDNKHCLLLAACCWDQIQLISEPTFIDTV